MPSLVEKSSSATASRGAGTIPDFPRFSSELANLPGAEETNAAIQKWNDLMKKRWVLLDEDLTKRFKIAAGFNDGFTSLQAQITEEQSVRATMDFAIATDLSTLSATFSTTVTDLDAEISTEVTARAAADSALSTSISTVSASLGTLSASVTTISAALATANSYLESRWTVKVTAGPIVTGMTLYSASGPDTDVSYIAFQADRFTINTASAGNLQVFSATGSAIKLGDVLTVDLTNQKVFIGTGTYANANTSFYVDAAGKFSLKDQLTWDGTTLSISSSVSTVDWNTQVTGRPTELTDGRIPAALSSAGLVLTGVHPGVNVTTGSAGLYLGADFLGYYNGVVWKTYMDNSGAFYLGGTSGALTWNGTMLAIANTSITGLGSLATASSVSWSSQVTSRPTELTDGRITAALNSAGLVITGVKPGINVTTGSAGLYLGADFLGYYNGATWKTYMDSSGNFYLGGTSGALTWNGSTLNVAGTITSTSGTIGGFTLSSTTLTGGTGVGTLTIYSNGGGITLGNASGARAVIYADAINSLDGFAIYNSANVKVADLLLDTSGGANAGLLNLYNSSGTLKVSIDGVTGTIAGTTLSGAGSSISGLNASNISSGTLSNARLPSAITVGTVTTGSTLTANGAGIFNSGFLAIGSCVISLGGLSVGNSINVGSGSAGSPTYTFGSNTNTGWFLNGSGDMRASTSGLVRFVIRDTAIVCLAPLKLDNSFVGGAPTATGYVTIQDAGGATYKLLAGT